MSLSRVTALLRVGVTGELPSTDAGRVVLLNAIALFAALVAATGLLVPATYTVPAFVLTAAAPIGAAVAVFVLHARGAHGAAAITLLATALFVSLLPPLLVSPWTGNIFFLLPLAALPER